MASSNNPNEEGIVKASREAMDVLYDLSVLLGTGLDRQTLALCISMVEDGTNPLALATVVRELRREAEARSAKSQVSDNIEGGMD